jgi:hypothetical protein
VMNASSASTFPNPISITGSLQLGAFAFTAQSTLATSGTDGRIYVQNAAAALTVEGNATFDGGDNNGYFTAGLLDFKGNLTVPANNNARSFSTPVGVTTRFSGSSPQTITFAAGATLSSLGSTNISATADVTAVGNILVTGTMGQTNLFTVTGMLSLFPSSTTTINGTLVKTGGCTNLGGAIINGTGTGASCP